MDKITNERLRQIVDKTYCRLDEGEEMAAELLALRSRVGWLDHLDTPEGRAMHATETVRAIEQHKHLLDLIREVAVSGVEIKSRQYVTVQISPETWAKIQEVARG